MKISHTSSHGIIIELGDGDGYRLVTKNGLIGPTLDSPASIAQKMPYTNWIENGKNQKVDLDTWLKHKGLTRQDVLTAK